MVPGDRAFLGASSAWAFCWVVLATQNDLIRTVNPRRGNNRNARDPAKMRLDPLTAKLSD